MGSAIFPETYEAKKGDVVYCDAGTPGYMARLPSYDPEYSPPEKFYNACYFGFRCCTTTGNGKGCYTTDSYGSKCRSCLQSHPPRVIRKLCKDYVRDFANAKKTGMTPDEAFTKEQLKAGGNPPIKPSGSKMSKHYAQTYAVKFLKPGFRCWVQPGDDDVRRSKFGEKCFEVLSWCNLLCPRDTANSVGHVMCKHCALFGFEQGRPQNVKSYQDK